MACILRPMPRTSTFPPAAATPRIPWQGHLLALAVLVGLVLVTVLLWRSARDREIRSARAEFIAQSAEITDRLRQKLVQYDLMTAGGAALFDTVRQPTPAQWAAYVQSLDVQARFPGMVGFGFAPYVTHSRLPGLQLAWRDAGRGLLNVRPAGVRPAYVPVLLLEPRTPDNIAAFGFDMYSEAMRRHAMSRAIISGRPQLTAPVQLVQDQRPEVGLLLYRPVFRDAASDATPGTREEGIVGFVYLPLRARALVADTLAGLQAPVHFRATDVTGGNEMLLYASHAQAPGRDGLEPAFRHATTLSHYGRTWRVAFQSAPMDALSPRIGDLENLLALGLVASLLMYAITLALVRTEARAHRIATRMTEDFRRSEQRFRVAMEHSSAGVALLDSHGMIVQANPALGAIVGQDPAFLAGRTVGSLLEAGADAGDSLAVPAAGGEPVRATRRLHRAGESPRQVHLTIAPVEGVPGEDITGLLQVEDVTERLRAEARVHALNRTLEARVELRTRELQNANEELQAFAYSVSHDLRAPLRAIDGFSRALQDRHGDALDEAGRGYVQRLRQSAMRMNGLIDALLSMTRLSRAELHPERLDISQLAREVLDDLAAGDATHAVRVEIADGLHAHGDPALVRNLLVNLLGNAWKFTRDRQQPWIALDAAGRAEGLVEFRVRDNGAGFSQDYVDKLFRPFQRLHAASQFEGHGIGLASVRRIVERHGGSVRAQGVEGQGATFWFTLPE